LGLSLYTKIPEQYKAKFARELLRDNFSRLFFVAILFFCIELILLLINSQLCDCGDISLVFIITSLLLFPFIWYVKKNFNTVNFYLAKIIQYVYTLSVLFFGCALVLMAQGYFDTVHVYMMVVFGISFFIYMNSLESAGLLIIVYVFFYVALPYFQPDPTAILVIRVNSLIFNIFAWILGRMAYNMNLSFYLNRQRLREKNVIFRELAQHDSMTGLLNHEVSFQRLKDEIERAGRIGYPLSLIIADIDDFKSINDQFGHLIGDHVIVKIAETIRETIRATDIVGRYGGEEFMIIMPDTNIGAAKALLKRLQQNIKEINYEINTKVNLSYGVSQYSGETLDDFIRNTDEKLYKAKQTGKNKFES